jgi:hypothetical protein
LFEGKANSARVYAYAESLGTSAVAYSGWDSIGNGKLTAYSVARNAKYAIIPAPVGGNAAIDSVYAKTEMVTDSDITHAVTFTSNSGLWLKTTKPTTSGDITKFGINAISHVVYPSQLQKYESNLDTGPDRLTATGIDTKIWNWNEASKAWNVIPNQYGMNRYYTTIPVTWRFHAVDRPNSATNWLDSKAGDLNDDGIVTLSELVQTQNMWNRGEVTLAYAKAAENNWKTSP